MKKRKREVNNEATRKLRTRGSSKVVVEPTTKKPQIIGLLPEYNYYTYIEESTSIKKVFGIPKILGLYASKDFKKGEIVATYGGDIMSINEMEAKNKEDKTHAVKIHFKGKDTLENEWIINGKNVTLKTLSKYNNERASFANSTVGLNKAANGQFRWIEDEDNKRILAKLSFTKTPCIIQHKGFYAIIATRDIKKSEEIFLKYEFKKYLNLT